MSTPDANDPQRPPVPAYSPYPVQQQTPPPYVQQPQYGQYAQPQYGQYAQPQYAQAQHGQPDYYSGKRPVRTADAIVSVVLLVLGLIGTLFAFLTAWELDAFMQGGYDSLDLGAYERGPGYVATQAVLIASHLVLVALSTTITIVLIVKRKVSFWLPLSAGVLAAIVYWVALLVLMYTDPGVIGYLQSATS